MNYLNLDDVKKHLNVDEQFDEDDLYIAALCDVAEDVVERTIDNKLENLENEDGEIPSVLIHAMYLFIGTQYAYRESITQASASTLPHSFDLLCDLYKDYTHKCAYKNIEV